MRERRTRLLIALATLSTGCWLDGDEWALKRYEVEQAGLPTDEPPPNDLGLGVCVQELFDGSAGGFLSTQPASLEPPAFCASGSGQEIALGWDVRNGGCWVLDAEASDYPVLVYGQDACTGDALFCAAQGPAIVDLDEGPVLLVVDATTMGVSGEWKLDATPLVQVDLGTNTATTGDTTGRPSWESRGCGAEPAGAATYLRFTPVSSGTWEFQLLPEFDAVLSVHMPCTLDTSLQCSDELVGDRLTVRADLAALEEVLVRVAGKWPSGQAAPAQGAFTLYMQEI
ncbi:MAG: hypothetical protein KC656_14765 [Myxococcales bacterium]|nr:hypothetical protein [Myxococcales bacterium]MCB9672085.1 hypothetical protein [Alphaproteobacteria bacterium]MCB9693992.1 hypothetical protein [Alphaproteobacteria bacterium]